MLAAKCQENKELEQLKDAPACAIEGVRDHKKVKWRKTVGFLPGMKQTQNDKAQLISMLPDLPTTAMALSPNLPTALTVLRGTASSSSAGL